MLNYNVAYNIAMTTTKHALHLDYNQWTALGWKTSQLMQESNIQDRAVIPAITITAAAVHAYLWRVPTSERTSLSSRPLIRAVRRSLFSSARAHWRRM